VFAAVDAMVIPRFIANIVHFTCDSRVKEPNLLLKIVSACVRPKFSPFRAMTTRRHASASLHLTSTPLHGNNMLENATTNQW
jgi:hypothetical protein